MTLKVNTENIRYDAWMSNVLGKDSYNLIINDHLIQRTEIENSVEFRWIKSLKKEPVFTFTKIKTTDITYIEFAEKLGFNLIDTNISLIKKVTGQNKVSNKNTITYHFAAQDDESGTTEVAKNSFIYTRFHLDNNFKKKTADKIKSVWVNNFYKGKRGDYMVVAKNKNQVVAFLQIILKQHTLLIDLIAVDANNRGKGIAANMIRFAMNNIKNIKEIVVGTQIANIPSIILYQKLGFYIHDAKYVFHYHN